MKIKTAIIGTGISGMACAHFLQDDQEITLFEKNNYVGGHTNTIDVNENGSNIPIDTGFMVFNKVNYPNLLVLFEELGVPIKKTAMSFSVQHLPSGLEYSGTGFDGLFAQRKNFFNPGHLKMLMQINRFNKQSVIDMESSEFSNDSLYEYIKKRNYGADMMFKYLLPMSSALWSTPTDISMQFPAIALVRFFKNHGFLGLDTQHEWYTVAGGSKEYRERLVASFKDKIKINEGAKKVIRKENNKVTVISESGNHYEFDQVIFACHADQVLPILENPTKQETAMLGNFSYQKNIATLHTDSSVMPKNKKTWSSWNYRIESKKGKLSPSTVYFMNSLQQVSQNQNYFVSINDPGNVDPKKTIKEIEYDHPIFTVKAMETQKSLGKLNESGPVFYCGSYFRYGFHEDAFTSSVELCKKILGQDHPKVKKYETPLFNKSLTSV
ncbi:MAG: FAD-dependent oxidoreductase [Bacteroidota bacterium]|nr:FAD-dependent oxidoreductase [Bacteroidota bacterium]